MKLLLLQNPEEPFVPQERSPHDGGFHRATRKEEKKTTTVTTAVEVKRDSIKVPSHVKMLQQLYPDDADRVAAGNVDQDISSEEQLDDEQLLERSMQEMRTGEDAVAFFAKNGTQTSVKFIHAVSAVSESANFRPYDLEIVHDSVNELTNYYTISPSGLVHTTSEGASEFIPLADWMHEALTFSVLSSLPFFRFFRQRKTLLNWLSNSRRLVYERKRANLAKNLIYTKPLYIPHMVKFKALAQSIADVTLARTDARTYQLQDWVAEQSSLRSAAAAVKQLEILSEELSTTLDALMQDLNVASRKTDEEDAAIGTAHVPGGTGGKTKSMVQVRHELEERARLLRIAKRDQAGLSRVVAWLDLAVVSALVDAVIRASEALRERLEGTSKLFNLSVSFGATADAVVLTPSKEEFVAAMSELWHGVVHVVGSVGRVTRFRQVEGIVASGGERLEVPEILATNAQYQGHFEAVVQKLSSDFERAQAFVSNYFSYFRPIHEYGATWDEKSFTAPEREHSLEDLARQMSLMKAFIDDLDKYKTYHVIGTILVDGKQLKQRLTPIPNQALTTMKRTLLGLARTSAAEVLSCYEQALKALAVLPTSLETYMTFLKLFREHRHMLLQYREAKELTEAMYALLKQYGVKIPIDDQNVYEQVLIKADQFTNKCLLEASTTLEERRQEMGEEFTFSCRSLDDEARKTAGLLDSGLYVNPELLEEASEVLEELRTTEKEVERIEGRAKDMVEYSKLLELATPVFEEVEALRQRLSDRRLLWQSAMRWQELLKQWYTAEFMKLDTPDMHKTVQEFQATVARLAPLMQGDLVLEAVKEMVGDWAVNMPILLALGIPEMRQRHWEAVLKTIGLSAKGAAVLTVSLATLEQNGLFAQGVEFAQHMGETAREEAKIEAVVETVAAEWTLKELPITFDAREMPWLDVEALEEQTRKIHEHKLVIEAALANDFVQGVREKVDAWAKKLTLAQRALPELLLVQRRLAEASRNFADSAKATAFPDEAGKVKQVEKNWKELFRKIRQSYRKTVDSVMVGGLADFLTNARASLDLALNV